MYYRKLLLYVLLLRSYVLVYNSYTDRTPKHTRAPFLNKIYHYKVRLTRQHAHETKFKTSISVYSTHTHARSQHKHTTWAYTLAYLVVLVAGSENLSYYYHSEVSSLCKLQALSPNFLQI